MNSLSNINKDQTIIEAEGLGKVYWDGDKTLQVLKDVNLKIDRGQGVAILGPSGSGKTTLLNILSGLDTPSEGSVRIFGSSIGDRDANERSHLRSQKLGFVFQFYHLLAEFTALENVMLPGLLRDRSKISETKDRARELLKRMGLEGRMTHFPSELSGGEAQRVAIARALINDPEIIFCDEPTGNLDHETGSKVAELLQDLYQRQKKTVLIVTHDPSIAHKADKVWNMATQRWD